MSDENRVTLTRDDFYWLFSELLYSNRSMEEAMESIGYWGMTPDDDSLTEFGFKLQRCAECSFWDYPHAVDHGVCDMCRHAEQIRKAPCDLHAVEWRRPEHTWNRKQKKL